MGILVTGGAGYIGSHTCLALLEAGLEVIVIDNLSNGTEISLKRIQKLVGQSLTFHQVDLLDRAGLTAIFERHAIDSVVHFAAFKAVGESVTRPLTYYHNNITGTINLCQVMQEHNVKNLVFSSSATVYGNSTTVPVTEDFPLTAISPYGQTKLIGEQILKDLCHADSTWNVALLRYFNPVGAHESGQIGEDPNDIPSNLMPYVSQVAVGKLGQVRVFGGDYPTPDGTGIRDFIHVVDLADGHLRALKRLTENPGLVIYNLGTGRGYSVLEVIAAFERACGKKIPYQIVERREGDVVTSYADPSKAQRELGWTAERDIDDMCVDAWRWQSQNPNGYE